MHFQQILAVTASQGGGQIDFDSDADTYFAGVVSAGGAALDLPHKNAVNNLILGLKTDSLWTRLDEIWLFANQHTTAAALGLKGRTATLVSSPTFTADQGYAGNGTSSYVNSTFNPSSHGVQYTRNSAHVMIYDRTSRTTSGTESLCGNFDGSTTITDIAPRPGGTAYIDINGIATPLAPAGPANVQGCWIATRTSSLATAAYRNGSSFASSGASASVAVANLAMFVGALNNAASAADFTSDQFAAFSVGASLDATQAANLTTRIEAYMDALGTGVI